MFPIDPAGVELSSLVVTRFALDGGAMFGVVPRTLWSRNAPADDLGRIEMFARVVVARFRTSGRIAVIDAGFGAMWSNSDVRRYALEGHEGGLEAALARIGIAPGDVTDAVITHLHFDHAGGWVRPDDTGNPVPALPNATHHVQRSHYEWARGPSPRDRASFISDHFEPIADAGLMNVVEGDVSLFDGLGVMVSDGHTPGMQMPVISGPEGTAVFTSDLIPTLAHGAPSWIMAYDLRPLESLEEKVRLLEIAHSEGWTVLLDHDPRNAAARVQMGEKGLSLVPCDHHWSL